LKPTSDLNRVHCVHDSQLPINMKTSFSSEFDSGGTDLIYFVPVVLEISSMSLIASW
jgi:hypothetical protein